MSTSRDIVVRAAELPRELPEVHRLFRAYAGSLDIDLAFQHFEQELATLPGAYAPPAGRLVLAWRGGEAVGCVALRPIDERRCEMKRLYVAPAARGEHLGRRLAQRICDEARAAGYARMYLDTLPTMHAAIGLYTDLGFEAVAPYVFNPIPGAMFLALDL